jgi:hypothetical protein
VAGPDACPGDAAPGALADLAAVPRIGPEWRALAVVRRVRCRMSEAIALRLAMRAVDVVALWSAGMRPRIGRVELPGRTRRPQ